MLGKWMQRLIAISSLLLLATAGFAQANLPTSETRSVPGSRVPFSAQVRPDATPAANKALHLTFALTMAHKADMEAYIASQHDPSSPNFQHWLTPAQFGQMFGANLADLQVVVNYIKAQGFNVTHVWPNRLYVSADTTVAQAERAFNIHIGSFERPRALIARGEPGTFFAPDRDPQLPAPVAARLQGIYGMSDLIRVHPNIVHGRKKPLPFFPGLGPKGLGSNLSAGPLSLPSLTQPPPIPTDSIGPAQASRAYNVDPLHAAGLTGQGMTIGIYSPTAVDLSDVANFAAYYGFTNYNIQEEPIDGGPLDFDGEDEANLDMDVILGQAPSATIVLYEAPEYGNLDIWNLIVSDDYPVISDSWAGEEIYTPQSYVTALDPLLAELDAQGQAHYNSSGDDGAYDYTGTKLTVLFPPSDSHTTAVGGTSLFVSGNNGGWEAERGWEGSGGGLSIFIARPSWQTGPGVANGSSNGMRQVPDVAALADPGSPGWIIYDEGQWQDQIGGTSASTPLWAAANLLIDQGAGKRLGNTNADLYNIGTNLNDATNTFVFHDITVGDNLFYFCTPKWDFVTGWGSPNFYKLYLDLLPLHKVYIPALLPNLHPIAPALGDPAGPWTLPIMIHTNPRFVAESGTFDNNTTYYFAAAVGNDGPADAMANVQDLQIDGVDHPFTLGAFAAGQYKTNIQIYSTELTPGQHTLKLIANSNGTVQEGNTADNVYTRVITVQTSPLPNIVALMVNPTNVIGGSPATGTLILDSPSPAGGITINLASGNTQVATVPSSVAVPAAATKVTFPVTTNLVAKDTSVTITATYNGIAHPTSLNVEALIPQSVRLVPPSVTGGTSSAGTVTLNGAVPAGGVTVTLSSSNTQAATVPASVFIGPGGRQANFNVTTNLLPNTNSAIISASFNGITQTATLSIRALIPESLRLAPVVVTGGTSSTGTVTLDGAAPTGGATITLTSSNTQAATVPSTITIPAGATTATFTINTNLVASTTSATISAKFNGVTQSGALNIQALIPASLALAPNLVTAGSASTGTVTLNGTAPAPGVTVTLTCNNTQAATVPASVTVPAGANAASFTINTSPTTGNAVVNITAAYNGVSRPAVLVVRALALASLSLNPTQVTGGTISTGTVTLVGPAPAKGLVVTLSSSNTQVATVPASVTIPAGATTATFTVTTNPSANNSSVTISATYNGTIRPALLLVRALTLTTLTLSPTVVTGGTSSTGTITLDGAAPTGGAIITLTSSNTQAATVPASVTIPAGATTATFTVSTTLVSKVAFVLVNGTYKGISRPASLVVQPLVLTSLTVAPTNLTGGTPSTGTIALNGAAPTGGVVVTLTSNNPQAAKVPASVTIPAGALTATFTITTSQVQSSTFVTITASYNGITRIAALVVQKLTLSTLTISPVSVLGSTTATGTVSLNGPAPPGGVAVALLSSNSQVATVPSSVLVGAGATTATFTVNTIPVPTNTSVLISASFNSVGRAQLTVQAPTFTSLTVNPDILLGGNPSTGTVTINGPAPTAGTTISLISSDPAVVIIPGSVTIPAGATTANFPIKTLPVTDFVFAAIRGFHAGVDIEAPMILEPPP
jgi:hypothetical protein